MPAVVRVKRRIDEEPLGAFVLNGKKRRLDDQHFDQATTSGFGEVTNGIYLRDKDEVSTILKFAGTMQSQDDGAISQIARLSRDEAKKLVQQKSRKPSNHTERARQEMRQSLHENRFRVVNCLRTTLDTIDENDGATSAANTSSERKEITIVDVEKHAVTNSPIENASKENIPDKATADRSITACSTIDRVDFSTSTDSGTDYVYDLYIPDNDLQATYVDLMDDNYLRLVLQIDHIWLTSRFI